ncbi:uncharacterized protein LACBIDRAFT_297927 [Laccaria bicolor S238N-H82]|uniref:Predicted protein n=1 Tax=Laccaria bicolor (strain S238N-H82 / ATCC MYA-4686) TaxID=486041 RepID=B0DBU5_LACBS|nr:uncharacterized protein LACBIDRAFT_297927 [Laccaria bicolor S238N-H82]EDR07624.1 predicted protein [Laccaria bicolor S238N-H82]|eukprot:XP_001881413.1 predicted protein [Laccaria bicolor S238N-H82]
MKKIFFLQRWVLELIRCTVRGKGAHRSENLDIWSPSPTGASHKKWMFDSDVTACGGQMPL